MGDLGYILTPLSILFRFQMEVDSGANSPLAGGRFEQCFVFRALPPYFLLDVLKTTFSHGRNRVIFDPHF